MLSMTKFRKVKSEDDRQYLIETLNQRVMDLTDLFIQTKLAHWNVRGTHFIAYHELFDELAGHIPDLIDTIAEQAASLGGSSGKPVQFIASETSLPVWSLDESKDIIVLEKLTEHWAIAANNIRDDVDKTDDVDAVTSDLLTEVSRQLDQDLWFLDAHLTDGENE